MYADLLVTLFEDGLVRTSFNELWRQLESNHRSKGFDFGVRDRTVTWLSSSAIFHEATVTYRGLRRIDELRDQLRRDRVLERFGILLDGRYIISDLIDFLERTNGEPVSFIFGDVDDFKRFNTEHGYKAGDAVLRHVFGIARRVVGNRGEVYRRGGEEIVALLPYFDLAASKALAERIRQEVEKTAISFDERELHATLSIGVASSPPNDPDGPGLETHAEIALNQAKGEGKNRVQVS
jgi:diguanylate cyclase (GGDEF)-like protein